MHTTSIYGLVDPEDGAVFYVGKADDPDARLKSHLRPGARGAENKKQFWIDNIRERGGEPTMTILATVPYAYWEDAERAWIAYGKRNDWPLTNQGPGGWHEANRASRALWLCRRWAIAGRFAKENRRPG